MAGGRPTIYTEELGREICEKIALGSNFNRLNKDPNYPNASTLFKWLKEHEEFSKEYAIAVTERGQHRYDSIDDEIDLLRNGTLDPQTAKIIIDTKKWQCSKEDAKKYGDKTALVGDKNSDPINVDVTDRTLNNVAFLIRKAQEEGKI